MELGLRTFEETIDNTDIQRFLKGLFNFRKRGWYIKFLEWENIQCTSIKSVSLKNVSNGQNDHTHISFFWCEQVKSQGLLGVNSDHNLFIFIYICICRNTPFFVLGLDQHEHQILNFIIA